MRFHLVAALRAFDWTSPLEAISMRNGDCKSYSIAKYVFCLTISELDMLYYNKASTSIGYRAYRDFRRTEIFSHSRFCNTRISKVLRSIAMQNLLCRTHMPHPASRANVDNRKKRKPFSTIANYQAETRFRCGI